MDQPTIEQLRARLTDEREHALTQLGDMGVDPATGQPDGEKFEQGFADSGQATAEKALTLSMAEGLIETLREIEAAFERMDTGTFGTCEKCGKPIGDERLDARPVARLCMSCKRLAG
jgi:RNA polymerase-binding protein DksA